MEEPSLPYDHYYRGMELTPPSETGMVGVWYMLNDDEDGSCPMFYFMEDYTFVYRETLKFKNDELVSHIAGRYHFENEYELHMEIESSYQVKDGKEVIGALIGTTTKCIAVCHGDSIDMMEFINAFTSTGGYNKWASAEGRVVGTWRSDLNWDETVPYVRYTFNEDGTFRYELVENLSREVLNYFAGTYTVEINTVTFTVTEWEITCNQEWYTQIEGLDRFTVQYFVWPYMRLLGLTYIHGSGMPFDKERAWGNYGYSDINSPKFV